MSTARTRRGSRTVVQFPGVTVHFQLYPGVHGTDAARGISGVPYQVHAQGRLIQSGQTGADGALSIALPTGVTDCTLRIFGVEYNVRIQASDPLRAPGSMRETRDGDHDPAFVGVRQRLYHLGYLRAPDAGFSDAMDEELDRAILDFQVNERLPGHADGEVGPQTLARLREREP